MPNRTARQPGLSRILARFLVAVILTAGPSRAADYFIAEKGDDGARGDSIQAAWRTIQRLNYHRIQPGDRILFEGGKSFSGNLRLQPENARASNGPVRVGSYGQGRATILAGASTGIEVSNADGITIENLVIAGASATNNSGYGILCENTLTNFHRLTHLRIDDVEARGFGVFGILITGNNAGFDHVCVTNTVLRDNLRGGMEIAGRLPYDSPVYAHADVRVTHCSASHNTGDPTYLKNHSGSGIVLYQVDGGLIDHCAAWDNGALCRAAGGGVGLWTCASRRVTIESCESFGNRTSGADGGGFDIDGGSIACVLQYNYSHDNDGPGLMVYTYPYASYADRDNIVRFNISDHDARKGAHYAGLWLRTDGRAMTGLEVYNNTVRSGPWTGQAAAILGQGVEAALRNNIFISAGRAIPLHVEQAGPKLRLENNLYWREDGPIQIAWDGQTYASLADWRASTGQEQLDGQPTGFFANPGLTASSSSALPSNMGKDQRQEAFLAFRLTPSSLAMAHGLDLRTRFGSDVGSRDFLGQVLPASGPFPLGAIGAPSAP